MGLKDEMGADTVKIFCPKCQCVYHPPPIRSRSNGQHGAGAAGVDGAAFGTTFPHLFLMTFSNLVPDPLPPNSAYVPRVFGFRVHTSAKQRIPAKAIEAGKASSKISKAASRKASSQGSRKGENNNDANPVVKSAETASSGAAAAAPPPDPEGTINSKKSGNEEHGDDISAKQKDMKPGGKRKSDSAGESATAKINEGHTSLIDNNSAKRRKKSENGIAG